MLYNTLSVLSSQEQSYLSKFSVFQQQLAAMAAKGIEFHKKKIRQYAKVRDADKDGFVTRHDYDLILERYKKLGVSDQHIKFTKRFFDTVCDAVGLTDHTKALTYEQFADNYTSQVVKIAKDNLAYANSAFDVVDLDGDGDISFAEWETTMKALGFDTAHARVTFDAMDTNGNNTIQRDEFADYHYEFFMSTDDKMNSSILFGPIN